MFLAWIWVLKKRFECFAQFAHGAVCVCVM